MPRVVLCFVLMISGLVALSCKREQRDRKETATRELPPLRASTSSTSLGVTGFGDAVLAAPSGVTRPTPVVIAVLGVGDSPEEQCSVWSEIVGGRAFVLCPRGAKNMVSDEPDPARDAQGMEGVEGDAATEDVPRGPNGNGDGGRLRQAGYYPVDLATLDREVTTALAALKARHGAYVADGAIVYAGFSRGAFLGASLAARHPARFRRVVLTEGGHSAWDAETAAMFARGGGERVLFVCGQPSCVEDAESAASTLRAAKLPVRIAHGVGAGHSYRKQVKEELRRSIDWVIEGDAAWTR